jgi:aspartyl-tRNA(Asn)/glutamyl-tRNA(Gln) amidotransferase subunit A
MRAVDFLLSIKRGEIDDVKLIERFRERVIAEDEKYNIFITLAEPDESFPRKRLLSGVPIAVKDNIVTKNLRTTCASQVLENFVPSYDATVVERIKSEGGVIVGKTNMDEFAMGALGTTSYFGPTRNPLNPSLSPGGSSSGSAAAVSSGLVPIALGSDTGGSIRLPAAWTGIYGLKPTYGLVSRYGLVSYSDSLDQIGPMASSIFDLELLFGVIMGWDEKDPTTYDKHVPSEVFIKRAFMNPDPLIMRNLRVALLKEPLVHEDADQKVVDRFMDYVSELEAYGALVEKVSIPLVNKAPQIYYVIAFSDASSNLARFSGLLYGKRVVDVIDTDWDEYYMRNRKLFGWEVKRRILLGSFILSAGYYEMYYDRALRARAKLYDELNKVLAKYDVIATPGSNIPPLPLDFDASDLSRLNAIDSLLVIANLAGLPAIVIPLEVSANTPISIQLISQKWSEDILFEIGKYIALYISKLERELEA